MTGAQVSVQQYTIYYTAQQYLWAGVETYNYRYTGQFHSSLSAWVEGRSLQDNRDSSQPQISSACSRQKWIFFRVFFILEVVGQRVPTVK